MRYIVLNSLVLAGVILMVMLRKPTRSMLRKMLLTVAGLCLLTLIFDPLIIRTGIVAYHRELTLGINVFGAPIEDFAYAIAAGLLLPVLWRDDE